MDEGLSEGTLRERSMTFGLSEYPAAGLALNIGEGLAETPWKSLAKTRR